MGKGDKKTKKGKIIAGTYGISRKKKKKNAFTAPVKKKAAPKKETKTKEPAKKTTIKKPAAKKTAAKKTTDKK